MKLKAKKNNQVLLLLFLLLLAFASSVTVDSNSTDDGVDSSPPVGRFDLDIDISGRWVLQRHEGCEEYMAVTGTSHFPMGSAMCNILDVSKPVQLIYQDCLELTIMGSTGSPIHHMILNDQYVTDDWTAAGTPARWTSKIVESDPLRDINAVSPTVVFVGAVEGEEDGGSFGTSTTANTTSTTTTTTNATTIHMLDARRYINEQGQLVTSWTAVIVNDPSSSNGTNSTTTFRIFYDRDGDTGCQGYEQVACSERNYTEDGQGNEGWTPACCYVLGDTPFNSYSNPNKRQCDDNDDNNGTNSSTITDTDNGDGDNTGGGAPTPSSEEETSSSSSSSPLLLGCCGFGGRLMINYLFIIGVSRL